MVHIHGFVLGLFCFHVLCSSASASRLAVRWRRPMRPIECRWISPDAKKLQRRPHGSLVVPERSHCVVHKQHDG